MGYLTPPPIHNPHEISMAMTAHKGHPCMVVVKVKYITEKDWVSQRLWIPPGWDQGEIWRRAYQWLHNDLVSLYYDRSEIEEVKFDEFKLV